MRSPTRTSRSLRHRGPVASDDDDRVHALVADLGPFAAHPDLRPLVGGRVEVVRRAPVPVGRPHEGVLFADRVAPEGQQVLDELGERRRIAGRDLQRQARDVVVRPAEFEVQHLEVAAALDDAVENGLEQLGVDEMTLGRRRWRSEDGRLAWCVWLALGSRREKRAEL